MTEPTRYYRTPMGIVHGYDPKCCASTNPAPCTPVVVLAPSDPADVERLADALGVNAYPYRFTYSSSAARITSDSDSSRSSATARAADHSGSATRTLRSVVPLGTSGAHCEAVTLAASLGRGSEGAAREGARGVLAATRESLREQVEALGVVLNEEDATIREDLVGGGRAPSPVVEVGAGGDGDGVGHGGLLGLVCRYSLGAGVGTRQEVDPNWSRREQLAVEP